MSLHAETPPAGALTPRPDIDSAESTAQENELFRAAFERSAVGMAHLSTGGVFLRVNAMLCEMTGYGPAELTGMHFRDVTLASDFGPADEERRARLAREGGSYSVERRYVRKNGDIFWVHIATTFLADAHGAAKYGMSVIEDITLRKRAEFRQQRLMRLHGAVSKISEAAVASRERMAMWMLACRIGVERGGLPFMLVAQVDSASEAPHALASHRAGSVVLPDQELASALAAGGALTDAIRGGRLAVCDIGATAAAGPAWHDLAARNRIESIACFPLGAGRFPTAALVVAASEGDYFREEEIELLTTVANCLGLAAESLAAEQQRRQAEEQVRRQEVLLTSAKSIAGVSSWDFDVATGRLYGSDETMRILGMAREDFGGTAAAFLELVHPDDREGVRSRFVGEAAPGSQVELEYRIVRPDGEERVLLGRGAAIEDGNGQTTGRTGMVIDITDRRLAEARQRRQADRLAALVEAQRELANSEATAAQLIDRAPALALGIVDAAGALFELVDGDSLICGSFKGPDVAPVGMRFPMAGSLSGEAIRLNRTMRCDDSETDPRVAAALCRQYDLRSVLATVVRDREGAIGVLKMFAHKPAQFGAAEADCIELLAEALGAAIQRKRAEEGAQRSLHIQAGIARIQQEMVASLNSNLQAMMDLMAERAHELTAATGAAIMLVEGDELVHRAASGMAIAGIGLRVKRAGSLVGLALERDELLRCDDSEADPRVNAGMFRAFGARSMLVAPLRAGDAVVGAIVVVSPATHAFAQREASTLQILAQWMGAVMQRAAVERQLRESEAQYRLVFASNPWPIWVFDTETLAFLAVNDAAITKYGYSRAEFLTMTIPDIRPARSDLDEYRAQGDPGGRMEGVWKHRTRDGTIFDAEASSERIRFGDRPGRLVLSHDVSGRLRARRELQKSEAMLSIASRVARVAGWSFDLRNRELSFSKDLHTLFDLPEGSALSIEETRALYTPESRPTLLAAARACEREGTPYDIEVEVLTHAGRRIAVRSIGQAVRDESGAIIGTQGAVQDISERKRAEDEMRALAARLTTTLESITDAFYTLDSEWRFTYVNDETERITRRTRQELLGQTVWEMFPAVVGTEIEHNYRAAVAHGRSVTFDTFYAPRRVWTEVHAYPSEAGLTVYFRDVTAARRADQQLRLLETCVAHMNDVLVIVDVGSEGVEPAIVFVNDAFVRSTGFSREEALGQAPRIQYGPLTASAEFELMGRALDEGRPARAELVYYRKDGSTYWVELEIIPVRSAPGEITHWIGVQRDTSERRLAEQALRSLNESLEAKVDERTGELASTISALASKEEEIRSVVEHMADAVINFDDEGTIRSANPMVESIFGYAPAELTGMKIATLIPSLSLHADDPASNSGAAAAGGPATREASGLHRQGDAIALELALSQYRIKGQRLWTVILRDIGQRLATMTALEQARFDAEQASRAKSAFVATMSHEIRTPMNGVVGMIDVLEQTELDADQSRMLGLARDSASSLMAIIEDILDFSKIEAGKIELEREPMSIPATVEHACALVAGVADSKGVELSIHLDAAMPAAVWGDAMRLSQVLVNLLTNAIKFSSGHRAVAKVDVTARASASGPDSVLLEFVIDDNGIGMDAATIARLFKPFAQGDASMTRRFGGTGLGLTISKELVELMGGEILVDSTLDVGSTFTVHLPFAVAPASRAPRVDGPDRRGAAVRRFGATPVRAGLILVAEDNEINQQVIIAQLKLLGFRAEMAGNGREALERWRSGRFAALVTDLQMPEMDGYELARSIRSEEAGGTRFPIIALTANALKDEASRCKAAGMDECLTKPVQLATLEAMLEQALAHTASGPPTAPAKPAPPTSTGPVEAGVLASLVGNDPKELRSFFLEFARAAIEATAALERAIAAGDGREAGFIAHRLKSSARAIGASRLADICAAIEAASQADGDTALPSIWQVFETEAAAVLAWIEANHGLPASAAPQSA